MTARDGLSRALAVLDSMTLPEVLDGAELQTRVDRKYVLPVTAAVTVLERMGERLSALEIEGLRLFRYESVYFDTPDLLAYRQHAHGRRQRVKVRTRAYLDSGGCLLEFKRVGGRGETVKHRYPYPVDRRDRLDDAARELAQREVGACIPVPALDRVLTTAYRRATLVDRDHDARLTLDVDLAFSSATSGEGEQRGPRTEHVILESKSAGGASPVDALLRRLGHRPLSLSKYCVGMAILDPGLPANRWNRELRTYFGWTPRRGWSPER